MKLKIIQGPKDNIRIIDSFISGSRVYGTPREDSDLDLVILCDEDPKLLWELKNKEAPSCMHGRLNFIIFTEEEKFNGWKKVTYDLLKMAPVTRDQAIAAFKEAGFSGVYEE